LLPAKGVAELVEECDPLCRMLGKSIATAKANRKPPSAQPLAMTNDKFSMANSQLETSKS
jgi:hypothetical protein